MPQPDDHRADPLGRLLAGRDQPSVRETEALFERIADEVAVTKPAWWRRPAVWSGALLVATTAAVLFVAIPGDEFRTKGGEQPILRPHCLVDEAADRVPCALGAKLVFEVKAPEGRRHFAAFAMRQDGTVIWYVPAPDQRTTALGDATEVLRTGVRLGAEHSAGRYRLFGVFAKDAMDRPALIDAVGDDLKGGPLVQVVERVFEVR